MKLWIARDVEIDMISVYTKKPLWDGIAWDQDGDYCASLVPIDAKLLFEEIPLEHELIEIDVIMGGYRTIQPPEQPNHEEESYEGHQ